MHEAPIPVPSDSGRRRAILLALFVAGLVLVAWRLSDVLLLGFGGVLVAVLLRHLAVELAKLTRLPVGMALAGVVLGIAALAVAFVRFAGPQVATQFQELWRTLPTALAGLRDVVAHYDWGRDLLEAGSMPKPGTLLNLATGLVGTVFSALSDALRTRAGAVPGGRPGILPARAAPPGSAGTAAACEGGTGRTRHGALELDPRPVGGDARDRSHYGGRADAPRHPPGACARHSRGAAQLHSLPWPVLAGAPAVLVAFAQGPDEALYTLGLFVLLQSFEGYVLTPMLQRRAVEIPPALGMLAIVGLGALFGTYGVLFATPLLVLAMILVQMLYVEDGLGDPDVRGTL